MKKIIIFLVLAIILVLPTRIKAGEMDSYANYHEYHSAYAKRMKNGVELKPSVLALFTIDDKTAYCVEPGVLADRWTYYNSTDDNKYVGISDELSKRLNLIGYYGYDYPGHQTNRYYMATQELIWRETGISDMRWEESFDPSKVIDIEYEKSEILRLIEEHKKEPQFDIKNSYLIGDIITLEDNNNVLKDYEVADGDIIINGNTITLTIKENNNFTLRRKGHGSGARYFYKEGYQTIGSFLSLPEYKVSYSIKGEYSKIVVNKLDFDTKGKNEMLEGATYALYDENNNKIDTKTTDENGMIVYNNIPKGIYHLKEINPSVGYILDNNTYEITVDNIDIYTIDVYEKKMNQPEPALEELPNTGKNDIFPFVILIVSICYYVKKYN